MFVKRKVIFFIFKIVFICITLLKMKWAEYQRHQFISKTLASAGYINRSHIMDCFGISAPQASIDLQKWQKKNPKKIKYNTSAKRYELI